MLRCYNLPPSSFVQRSLPAVLSACYVFDFCSTCTNAYLVSVNHVRAAPPPDA